MLAKAIEINGEADVLAMTCGGRHCFDRLDQLVCDADNICRDFIRRHGNEVMKMCNRETMLLLDRIDELHAALTEARKWIGDGPLSDGLDREYWTPEYIAAVDMVDAVLGPNALAQGREPLCGEASPGATGSTTPGNHGEKA